MSSRRAIAALFIARQHLDRPLARRLTAATLARFVEDVGGLQLDSINVVDRAHHLTLWSRFASYDRQKFAELVYRRRVLFEYWAHGACLVSAGHLGPWRRTRDGWQILDPTLQKPQRSLVSQSVMLLHPMIGASFMVLLSVFSLIAFERDSSV